MPGSPDGTALSGPDLKKRGVDFMQCMPKQIGSENEPHFVGLMSQLKSCLIAVLLLSAICGAQNDRANAAALGPQGQTGAFHKLVACRSNEIYYAGGECAAAWGGGDIGSQVNAAIPVAAGAGGGAKVVILPGTYSFTTPIVINGSKPITLECAPGGSAGAATGTTILRYTPTTGTAVTWSAGANGGGMSGCTLKGSGSSNSTGGLFVDTIQGGIFSNLDITGFGKGIEINSHANKVYIGTFNGMYVHDNGTNLYTAPTGASNENITFQGGVFFNRTYGAACASISNFEMHFINVSFDSCPIQLGGLNAHYSFIGSHFELTEGSTPIDPVVVSAECKACDVTFSDDEWVENVPNRSRTEFVTINGSGNYSFIGEQIFAAETVPQFATLNNNTASGTWCCGVTFGGGSVSNIFNPNSTANGLGVFDTGKLILKNICPIQFFPGSIHGCLATSTLGGAQTWLLPNASGVLGLTLNKGSALYQAKRGTGGCATQPFVGGECSSQVTWTTPFADTNYSVSCQGTGEAKNFPILGAVTMKANGSITVQTRSLTAAPSSFAAIDCIAVHD